MQELIERFNTWPQSKFYLEHNQAEVQDYLDEHDLYSRQLQAAEALLRGLGRFQLLERSFLPNYQFQRSDIVVCIGQDGLVANTLKYLNGQPVVGVNPDPGRWDGKLLPFRVDDLKLVIPDVMRGHAVKSVVTFAEANTNTAQKMFAVNDLFIGPKSHTSARYRIQCGEQSETQSSSGIIISTGFGSTGWFQSILAGASGVMGAEGHPLSGGFAWDEPRLRFSVREPFPSQTTGTNLVFGEISNDQTLRLESYMPECGVMFSDGIEEDSIAFNSGCIVEIRVSERSGTLVS